MGKIEEYRPIPDLASSEPLEPLHVTKLPTQAELDLIKAEEPDRVEIHRRIREQAPFRDSVSDERLKSPSQTFSGYRPIPDLAPGEPGWERPVLPDYIGDPVASQKRWDEIQKEFPTAAERRRRVEMENTRPTAQQLHTPLR